MNIPQRRPAQTEDETFLHELFVTVRRMEFAALQLPTDALQSLLQMQFQAQQSSYCAQFPDSSHNILLGEKQPIGRIWTAFLPHEIRLIDIALLPAHQNRGIGTQLLRELIAQAAPSRPLRLSVALQNQRARRWYGTLGLRMTDDDAVHCQMQWPATELSSTRDAND